MNATATKNTISFAKNSAKTLYDKLWQQHVVHVEADGSTLIYIDKQLLHEVTSPQAFAGLEFTKRKLWRISANIAVPDHNVPTSADREQIKDPDSKLQVETLRNNCKKIGIKLIDLADKRQGIVHIIGPEQGITLPGMTIVCGDSHTSTHGAFATLSIGIGTSEVEHVLATQCLWGKKSKNMLIKIDGSLLPAISAKDLILYVIGAIGTAGATGYAIEYAGETIRTLSMEGRMTVCNMSIEAGARCGMVACDQTTLDYLKDRPLAPRGKLWDAAVASWQDLHSDPLAKFDKTYTFVAEDIAPQVTWGTSPGMVCAITDCVPDPAQETDHSKQAHMRQALAYMGLKPGTPIQAIKLDQIFIGSCTNSRIEDLRIAANIVAGKKIASNIQRAMVVPGSGLVKHQAEQEGIAQIFVDAGFEWREAGCSMCLGMNPDKLPPYQRCASTSNRNFEGRQGALGRTHLVSPAMAAAAAINGHFVDVRTMVPI